jgi:protein-tyrosine-phosphatase
MAEYLATNRSDPTTALFESAGIEPGVPEDTRNAVEALRSCFRIDASAHVPRGLGEIDLSRFATIVAIDDSGSSRVFQELKNRGVPTEVLVRWKVDDPYGDDLSAYDRCACALIKNLHRLQET